MIGKAFPMATLKSNYMRVFQDWSHASFHYISEQARVYKSHDSKCNWHNAEMSTKRTVHTQDSVVPIQSSSWEPGWKFMGLKLTRPGKSPHYSLIHKYKIWLHPKQIIKSEWARGTVTWQIGRSDMSAVALEMGNKSQVFKETLSMIH